jgi:hypothetical protein
VDTGYDPQRVRELSHHTADAIDGLRWIRSDDPAAEEAMRAIRLTRRNLEDLWMPTLVQIVRSNAMVSWTDAALDRTVDCQWTAMSSLTDDVLLGYVTWADPLQPDTLDLDVLDLDVLARELALRVARDPVVADRLLALASTTTLIGDLTGRADFPSTFLADVVTAMMWPHGPQTTVDLDGYADSLSTAMAGLLDDPASCLDLLLDPAVLYGVASWERLDSDIVREFALAGLYDAVAADPGRLADGYRVIATLTTIANGPLDHGLNPAMAVGIAASMAGYMPTLAPALTFEANSRSVVTVDDVDIDLGTYDDLVGLFGVVLRDPAAQAAIGPAVSEYATQTVTDLGAGVGTLTGVEHVADFADLLVDATRAEESTLMAEAAAEEWRRRQLGGALGFGLSAVATVFGGGAAVRSVVSTAVRAGTELMARVEPGTMPDGLFGPTTYNLITMTAVSVVVDNPRVRRELGLDSISPRQLAEMSTRLDEIATETDLDERATNVRTFEHWIATEVPPLDAHLNTVKKMPGMDALKE